MSARLVGGDKAAVRDLTEEAIAGGSGAAELRRLRADLADSLGVSRRSLGSVSAYVEYSATEALTDSGVAGRITNTQLITAARLVRGSATVVEDTATIACDLGLSASELAVAITTYERYYQGRPDGSITDSTASGAVEAADEAEQRGETTDPTLRTETLLCPPPSEPVVVLADLSPPDLPIHIDTGARLDETPNAVSGAGPDDDIELVVGGDIAEYNTQPKNEWRDMWAEYIRSQFGPGRLRDARVVCLPGRAVELEVAKYLAMGVRAENIYCVEKSARVRDEFLANAARLGVRAFTEPLDRVLLRLGSQGVQFDIANFDFIGPPCKGHCEALHALPLSGDALVIYNALGKRDPKAMSARMEASAIRGRRSTLEVVTPLKEPQSGARGERLVRYFGKNASSAPIAEGPPALSDLRHEFLNEMVTNYSGARWTSFDRALLVNVIEGQGTGYDPAELGRLTDRQVRGWINPFHYLFRRNAPVAVATFMDFLNHMPGRLFRGCDPLHLGLVVWHASFGIDYIVGSPQQYDYLSEPQKQGTARSPFCTHMSRLRKHETVLPDRGGVVRFCSEFIRLYTRECSGVKGPHGHPWTWRVVDSSNNMKSHRTPIQWDDWFHLFDEQGEHRASVRMGDLRHALLEATALERKEKLGL